MVEISTEYYKFMLVNLFSHFHYWAKEVKRRLLEIICQAEEQSQITAMRDEGPRDEETYSKAIMRENRVRIETRKKSAFCLV